MKLKLELQPCEFDHFVWYALEDLILLHYKKTHLLPECQDFGGKKFWQHIVLIK